MLFLPELVLLAGALALFVISLGDGRARQARRATLWVAMVAFIVNVFCVHQQGVLFDGAYRIDAFSQWLKLIFALGLLLLGLLSGELPDIQMEVKAEYFLFLTMSVLGLTVLVSSIDLISLTVALELTSFPLYVLVAMRRERAGQRMQMESAIKYIVFGITATGVMLFGMSYLFGLTGTTALPTLMVRLQPVIHTPLAIVALALTLVGLLYKLAVFPFHFWTPDVYEGASNETASFIASLPKIAAVAVLVRLTLASLENPTIALLLSCLAIGSMFYGNLIALMQKDLKRLLGFSGIAHAGYALIGFVALSDAGYTAALYYVIAYFFMVLACLVVICQISRDGANVALEDLAGLHRRSPLLALTLLVGVFALAGIPPFAGFMGKLSLLKAALAKGHLALVIIAVINSAIAIYYYLGFIREAYFRDDEARRPVVLAWPIRAVCVLLMAAIVVLGVAPQAIFETISSSYAAMGLPLSAVAAATTPF
ncbi:MAG: NADH-quinone oxidoreductase subunit N [Verrucomicrobiota bacterium]